MPLRPAVARLKHRVDRVVESVMLRPGEREAARLIVGLRYFLLVMTGLFLAHASTAWGWPPELVLGLSGINLVALGITVALSLFTTGRRRTGLVPAMMISFACDLVLEVAGLMSTGVSHSTIIVVPLLSLMAAGLVLEVKHTLALAIWFGVLYPAGALLVAKGWLPFPGEGPAAIARVAKDRLPVFAVAQESFFSLALAPYLVLVWQLRGLYRNFAARLESAVQRVEAEVSGRERERTEAQRVIAEREQDYRLLADNVTDLVALCDDRLAYTFVSPSSTAVLGYAPGELIGRPIRELVHPDDWGGLARLLARDGVDPGKELVFEHRAQRRDGQWRWLETRGRAMRLADGRSGVVLSSRDITRRRELEETVHQAQKLESLGMLAGAVAHDFNNLLTAILGNAELAARGLPPASPVHDALDDIVTASNRAADLCQQMLSYAGRGHTTRAPVNLRRLVEEMPALLGAAVPRQAALSFRLVPTPVIEGDAAQIRQIAMNLILNAAQALGAEGGEVVVASGAMTADEPFALEPGQNHLQWFATEPEGDYAFLRVSDTGCGMDQATLGKVFDPFFTTKPTGRGLGLAAVLGIVRSHRGFIRIASQPGRGTEMTVAFPASRRAAAEAPAPAAAQGWRGAGTALVVDDEPAVLEVATDMLELMGFSVLTAADGSAGLELFRRHQDTIRLVVCDLNMPGLDGPETIRRVRRVRPDTPIVLTSGFTAKAVEPQLQAGEARFLQKPFTYRALEEVVRGVVEG